MRCCSLLDDCHSKQANSGKKEACCSKVKKEDQEISHSEEGWYLKSACAVEVFCTPRCMGALQVDVSQEGIKGLWHAPPRQGKKQTVPCCQQ